MAKDKKVVIPKELEYKGFRAVMVDLKQRHIEKWMEGLDPEEKILPKRLGSIVRSAFKAGWFSEPVLQFGDGEDPIAEWAPDRVNWLSDIITKKYTEVMEFDPS